MIFSLPCKTMITPDYEYESVICEHYKKNTVMSLQQWTKHARLEQRPAFDEACSKYIG